VSVDFYSGCVGVSWFLQEIYYLRTCVVCKS